METLDTIRKRCSLKAHISPREIELEKLNLILEGGETRHPRHATTSPGSSSWLEIERFWMSLFLHSQNPTR